MTMTQHQSNLVFRGISFPATVITPRKISNITPVLYYIERLLSLTWTYLVGDQDPAPNVATKEIGLKGTWNVFVVGSPIVA